MITAIDQPAQSLPQGLQEASWAPRERGRRAGAGLGHGRLFVGPEEASGHHLNPTLHPCSPAVATQLATGRLSGRWGKPQRREQEPGRFQSTWPGLEFTQSICKSNANLSSFFFPSKILDQALLEEVRYA